MTMDDLQNSASPGAFSPQGDCIPDTKQNWGFGGHGKQGGQTGQVLHATAGRM